MLRVFQRLGYGLLADILFVFSYFVTAVMFVFGYSQYLYKWLPANPTGERIFFFLDDRRERAEDFLFDLCVWSVVTSARYHWLSNFTSANFNDAEELASEK